MKNTITFQGLCQQHKENTSRHMWLRDYLFFGWKPNFCKNLISGPSQLQGTPGDPQMQYNKYNGWENYICNVCAYNMNAYNTMHIIKCIQSKTFIIPKCNTIHIIQFIMSNWYAGQDIVLKLDLIPWSNPVSVNS